MNKTLSNVRNLVIMGMMLAITIILDATPLGAIPVGPVSATINHIPTVITGIILGPVAGVIMGAFYGIISLLHALLRPQGLLDPLFVNPIVSVLPRMTIGLVSYYIFYFFNKILRRSTLKPISIGVAAFFGSLANTVFVLGTLVIVYGGFIENALAELDMEVEALPWAIGIATAYGLPEAAISVAISIPIVMIYFRYFDKE